MQGVQKNQQFLIGPKNWLILKSKPKACPYLLQVYPSLLKDPGDNEASKIFISRKINQNKGAD